MSDDVLIRAECVSKKFCRTFKKSLWYGIKDTVADLAGKPGLDTLRPDEFWAVDDVSFELRRGECLGLIGRNGAGKTTLLKMLNGLLKPDKGRIEMRGRIGALIALGAGFNPILTGRENIYVNGSVLGLSKREIDQRFDEIVEFAEIDEFIETPVQSYSSGMAVRLGFAVATAMEPDVLLLDEVLAVGDKDYQAKCFVRIENMLRGAAVILVSHHPYHIRRTCDRAVLLEDGRNAEEGTPDHVLAMYDAHGYKQARQYTGRTARILSKNVRRGELIATAETISSGGPQTFRLRLGLRAPIVVDLAYFNISDMADVVHAQVQVSGLERRMEADDLEFEITIPSLSLSNGRYTASLGMMSEGGKKTEIVLRRAAAFSVVGMLNTGPFYYPPSVVSQMKE